uniref:Uncharacterized protein n=1 Tax=Panagrellus redivivus TaxID=6233 RepID=A0A7E4V0G8_PANRE
MLWLHSLRGTKALCQSAVAAEAFLGCRRLRRRRRYHMHGNGRKRVSKTLGCWSASSSCTRGVIGGRGVSLSPCVRRRPLIDLRPRHRASNPQRTSIRQCRINFSLPFEKLSPGTLEVKNCTHHSNSPRITRRSRRQHRRPSAPRSITVVVYDGGLRPNAYLGKVSFGRATTTPGRRCRCSRARRGCLIVVESDLVELPRHKPTEKLDALIPVASVPTAQRQPGGHPQQPENTKRAQKTTTTGPCVAAASSSRHLTPPPPLLLHSQANTERTPFSNNTEGTALVCSCRGQPPPRRRPSSLFPRYWTTTTTDFVLPPTFYSGGTDPDGPRAKSEDTAVMVVILPPPPSSDGEEAGAFDFDLLSMASLKTRNDDDADEGETQHARHHHQYYRDDCEQSSPEPSFSVKCAHCPGRLLVAWVFGGGSGGHPSSFQKPTLIDRQCASPAKTEATQIRSYSSPMALTPSNSDHDDSDVEHCDASSQGERASQP